MIQELWDYFTTSSTSKARANGYLYHSIALAHRARRCRQHWSEHLRNCHQLLNSKLPKASTLAVLGSGLLLETPPQILAQSFEKIDLIDVVHTKTVRELVGRSEHRERFRFVELDLNQDDLGNHFDFIISANLLSQLSYVPGNRLRKQGQDEAQISKLSMELQDRHLRQIRQAATRYLLFSDFQINIRDLKGEILDSSSTVSEQLEIPWQQKWSWNLAPAPEFSRLHSVELIVGCTTNY